VLTAFIYFNLAETRGKCNLAVGKMLEAVSKLLEMH
jgi:hypothetical protein